MTAERMCVRCKRCTYDAVQVANLDVLPVCMDCQGVAYRTAPDELRRALSEVLEGC